MAEIIPFPAARYFRSAELVTALGMLERFDSAVPTGDPVVDNLAEFHRQIWEEELVRLGGGTIAILKPDTGKV
ncbi:hypothetical protein U1839_05965 [Sphingomonas sp. RT2P30]|uniref:hypothetical protein n=1 Tax=Parasphingomonas halimpatiens TaxID=3096162 RepID=UPI002FC5BC4E